MWNWIKQVFFNQYAVVNVTQQATKCTSVVDNPFSTGPNFATSFRSYVGLPRELQITELGHYEVEIMCHQPDKDEPMLDVYSQIRHVPYSQDDYYLLTHRVRKKHVLEGFENATHNAYHNSMRYHGRLPCDEKTKFLVDYLRIQATIVAQYHAQMDNCDVPPPNRLKLPWVDYIRCDEVHTDPDERRNWFTVLYSSDPFRQIRCLRLGNEWLVEVNNNSTKKTFTNAEITCSYIMTLIYESRKNRELIDSNCHSMLQISVAHFESWLYERLVTMRNTPNQTRYESKIVYLKKGE